MIANRKYFRIGYKNNKSLFLMIDRFNIVNVHEIIEILVPMTYL